MTTFQEIVDLTLPGSWTPQTAFVFIGNMTRSVEVTHGGRVCQIGQISNFYIGLQADNSKVLCATINTDTSFDFEGGETLTVEDTTIGDLTISYRERTLLLPLFF